MSEKIITVTVNLDEWTDDEIRAEFKERGLSADFPAADEEDVRRWADLLRIGNDSQVLVEVRRALRDHLGLAML